MKPAIHFSHANGFPARCYQPFFERLGHEVSYVLKIGHGELKVDGDFEQVVTELILEVERRHREPVVGMGHSTGAVLLLLAAARRPELFSSFVLFDPVLFCPFKRFVIELTQRMGLGYQVGPVRASKKRRRRFGSMEEVRERYGSKSVFKRFHPECFDAYLRHGFQPSEDGGVELAFSAEVETEIFRSTQTRVPKKAYGLNGLMLYGTESNLLRPIDARWWRRAFPRIDVRPFQGGHLFPFEDPDGVAGEVRAHLSAFGRRKG